MRFDNRMLYSGFLLLMFTFHETQGSLDIKANVQSQSLDENEVLTILMTQMEELKQELQELKPKLKELEQTCAQKKDISVLGEESMPSSEPTECSGCDTSLPGVWVMDSGYIANMSALPIESIDLVVNDDYTPHKMTYHIGPIQCHGARSLPYPTSCNDVFLQRSNPDGWYLLGQPESLYVTFCQKRPNDESNTINAPKIPFEEQLNEAITKNEFLEEQLNLIHNSLSVLDKTTDIKMNELQSYLMEYSFNLGALKSYTKNLDERLTSLGSKVTFYAYATSSRKSGNVIKYDKVIINEFAAYDSHTGEFTAPVSGVYYIVADAHKTTDVDVYYVIRKNTIIDAKGHLADGEHDSAEKSTIIHLQMGDKVDVYLGAGTVYGSDSKAYTSFMGFLLYRT